MIGIYKITNLTNDKKYIGQSIHIERRFAEHCFPSKTSIISKAIQKYGKENFNFEILEECTKEELNDKENYWIQYYNTLIPNGYNIVENNEKLYTSYQYFDKEVINQVIYDLQYNNSLTLRAIAKKYNMNVSNVSRINKGETHRLENISYPLRKTQWERREKKYCQDCGKEISISSNRCNICASKLRRIKLEDMPINREQLKQKIRINTFTSIGKEFNVTDNTIKKWCDKFNLPRTKREINTYSDEEWDLL